MKKILTAVILFVLVLTAVASAEAPYTCYMEDNTVVELNHCTEYHGMEAYKAEENISYTLNYTVWDTDSGKHGGTYVLIQYAEDATVACIIEGIEDEDGYVDWDGTVYAIDMDSVEQTLEFVDWYFGY